MELPKGVLEFSLLRTANVPEDSEKLAWAKNK